MTTIPIVLASDKNCISQMYTTILSILENKNKDTFYRFYLLVSEKFSKRTVKFFNKLTQKYKNSSIRFINMKNAFSNIKMQIPHITSPTFYRLKIADILKEFDKALYLDIDTIILDDLSELFKMDLTNYYVAGVRSISYFENYSKSKPYYDSVGLEDMSCYINAGVMLWNLDKIRKDNITQKLIEMSKNDYHSMDQDIINIAFWGKIKHLDFKYNVMTQYKESFLDTPEGKEKIYNFYGKESIINGLNNPVIIHYAASKKPWNNPRAYLRKYYQFYAKKSPFKDNKKRLTIEKQFLNQVSKNKLKNIVFWGASLFLKDLISTHKIKKHKILGIIDRDNSKKGKTIGNFKIFSPDELTNLKPDIVIFSIKNNNLKIYPKVKEFLEENYPNVKLLTNPFEYN